VRAFVTERDQIVAIGDGEETLEDNFNRFHADNPQVYETLVKLARRWKRSRPRRRCSTKMLFETARWYLDLRGDGEPVALNNNYTAFYARLLMEQEPELAGLFETRRQRSSLDAASVPNEAHSTLPTVLPSSPADAASNEDRSVNPGRSSHGDPNADDAVTTRGGPVLVLFNEELPDQDGLFAA
jgi:hypothetical protein